MGLSLCQLALGSATTIASWMLERGPSLPGAGDGVGWGSPGRKRRGRGRPSPAPQTAPRALPLHTSLIAKRSLGPVEAVSSCSVLAASYLDGVLYVTCLDHRRWGVPLASRAESLGVLHGERKSPSASCARFLQPACQERLGTAAPKPRRLETAAGYCSLLPRVTAGSRGLLWPRRDLADGAATISGALVPALAGKRELRGPDLGMKCSGQK